MSAALTDIGSVTDGVRRVQVPSVDTQGVDNIFSECTAVDGVRDCRAICAKSCCWIAS